jgi:hypothetical protein
LSAHDFLMPPTAAQLRKLGRLKDEARQFTHPPNVSIVKEIIDQSRTAYSTNRVRCRNRRELKRRKLQYRDKANPLADDLSGKIYDFLRKSLPMPGHSALLRRSTQLRLQRLNSAFPNHNYNS